MRCLGFGLTIAATTVSAQQRLDRTVLPIHEPQPATITTLDARDAKAPPRFEVKAPAGAPNVVIVLIDDIGFGHSSAFGGPINMPTLEKLANGGLQVQPLSHHGAVQPDAHGAADRAQSPRRTTPARSWSWPRRFPATPACARESITTLAEILRQNGYSTAAFGKYHETPPWEVSVSGPYDRWPTGSGFDKFYGFIGGETNQWAPAIFDGVTRIEHAADAGLPLHHRHDRQGDQLGQRPAIAHARQAVLHVLRHRRDARAAPRAQGVDREVQGPVQRRLGQAARGNLRAAEEAGRDPGRHQAHAAARRRSPRGTT